MRFALTLLCLSISTAAVNGQALPEDPGGFAAGYVDVSVPGLAGGNSSVGLRVYYPATSSGANAPLDLSGAPYPPLVFGHGFSLPATLYASLFENLATRGYVSALVRTEEGLFSGDLGRFIVDMRAAVVGLRAGAQQPGILSGAVDGNARAAAIGHSFGGAAALVAASGHESLFSAVVTMAATSTSPQGIDILAATAALTQPCLHIGTDGDQIVPPAANLDAIHAATPSTRRKVTIAGGRHSYFHEDYWVDRLLEPAGNITVAEQQRLIRRYQNAFLDHFMTGNPRNLDVLLGPTAVADPGLSDQDTDLEEPLTFVSGPVAIGNPVQLHAAWDPGDVAWLLASVVPVSIPLPPYGVLLVDPATFVISPAFLVGGDSFGTLVYNLPADPTLSGTVVHVQAIVANISGNQSLFANSWPVAIP